MLLVLFIQVMRARDCPERRKHAQREKILIAVTTKRLQRALSPWLAQVRTNLPIVTRQQLATVRTEMQVLAWNAVVSLERA